MQHAHRPARLGAVCAIAAATALAACSVPVPRTDAGTRGEHARAPAPERANLAGPTAGIAPEAPPGRGVPLERLLEEPGLAVPKRNVTPPVQPPAEEKRAAITRREEAYVPAPDDAPLVAPHVTGLDGSPPASPALAAGRRLPVLVCRIDGDRLVPLAADEVASLLQGYGRSGDLLLTGLTASTDTLPLGALLAEARERRAPTLAVLRFVDTGGQRAAELRLYRSADGALLELHSGLVPSLTALGHRLRRSLEAPSGG